MYIQDAAVPRGFRWVVQEKFFAIGFCGIGKIAERRHVKFQEFWKVFLLSNAKQLQTPIPQYRFPYRMEFLRSSDFQAWASCAMGFLTALGNFAGSPCKHHERT